MCHLCEQLARTVQEERQMIEKQAQQDAREVYGPDPADCSECQVSAQESVSELQQQLDQEREEREAQLNYELHYESDLYGQDFAAQYDDDPNPYHGDYSEI